MTNQLLVFHQLSPVVSDVKIWLNSIDIYAGHKNVLLYQNASH